MDQNESYEKAVGLDYEHMVKFIIEAPPIGGVLYNNNSSIDNINEDEIIEKITTGQSKTILDKSFHVIEIEKQDYIPFNISTPQEIVILSAFMKETTPRAVLYPPSAQREKLQPCIIQLPIFAIDYIIKPILKGVQIENVISSLNHIRQKFEGMCCHEMLLKALRSQKNIFKNFDDDILNEAISATEYNINNSPDILLLNSQSLYEIKRSSFINGKIYGLNPLLFNPSQRRFKRRNYIFKKSIDMGSAVKTMPVIKYEEDINGNMQICYSINIGAIIINRSAITSIEN